MASLSLWYGGEVSPGCPGSTELCQYCRLAASAIPRNSVRRVDDAIDQIEAKQEFRGQVGASQGRQDDRCGERQRLGTPCRHRLFDRHAAKAELGAWAQLCEPSHIRLDHVGDLWIPAGRLPIGHQHEWLAVARHLDGAERDAIRHDVETLGVA